ncbi:hypothetical protein SPBR_02495 [Sporothrix brasiliensis 5110]|uniref:Uncharacterized protein n=1 Tax=Sporothrix brasiliensis 5110 TaxID=1398154 RepID=A0A0C2ITV3_9PEZI|nr:uncharacterized protein SPBR_02495 [Sporothrix brasiliensis 5110]KIH92526.1 hypothetical protein SPBR_02495 [Sporothrix brasiliensis 5110]
MSRKTYGYQKDINHARTPTPLRTPRLVLLHLGLPLGDDILVVFGAIGARGLRQKAAALAVDGQAEVAEQLVKVGQRVKDKVGELAAVAGRVAPLAEARGHDGGVLEGVEALGKGGRRRGRGGHDGGRQRAVEQGHDPERLQVGRERDGEVHDDAGKGNVAAAHEALGGRQHEPVQRVRRQRRRRRPGVRARQPAGRQQGRQGLVLHGRVREPREPRQDLRVGARHGARRPHGLVAAVGHGRVRQAQRAVEARRQKRHGRHVLPARGAGQRRQAREARAVGQVDGVGRQRGDLGNVDAHGAAAHEVEEVGRVVEDGKGRRREHGLAPGPQLGRLWVGAVLVGGEDVAAQEAPKGIGDAAAEGAAVVEGAHARVAVGVAPDAGAEPGQHARHDELLEPLFERRHVRRRLPDGAVARRPDDPLDLDALGGVRVDHVPGRLGAAEHGHPFGRRRLLPAGSFCADVQRVRVLREIPVVEQRRAKRFLAGNVWQERLRGQARRDNQLARDQRSRRRRRRRRLPVGSALQRQRPPAARGLVPHRRRHHLGVGANVRRHAKVRRVVGQVLVHDGARDVLARLHAIRRRVHGEVRVLVGAQQVVALEAGVQPVLGPDAAQSRRRIEHGQRGLGVQLVLCLGGAEAEPAGADDDEVERLSHVGVRE